MVLSMIRTAKLPILEMIVVLMIVLVTAKFIQLRKIMLVTDDMI